MIWPYLLFHYLQHHSISFSMALCCCPLYGLGFMSDISLLMTVLHCAISIAIVLSVALLISHENSPALMEPAAPPTARSSNPCEFLSLSIWMIFESLNHCLIFTCHILQSILLPTMQQWQKIPAAVFAANEYGRIKARQGCISVRGTFCRSRTAK